MNTRRRRTKHRIWSRATASAVVLAALLFSAVAPAAVETPPPKISIEEQEMLDSYETPYGQFVARVSALLASLHLYDARAKFIRKFWPPAPGTDLNQVPGRDALKGLRSS